MALNTVASERAVRPNGAGDSSAPLRSALQQRPACVFDPADPWTQAYHRGLRRGALEGAVVLEVGVGAGAAVELALRLGARRVYATDVDERVLRFAARALRAHMQRGAARLLERPMSLLSSAECQPALSEVDVVIGNLPQVIWTGGRGDSPKIADAGSHYYRASSYSGGRYNPLGLGLISELLVQVRRLSRMARVLLTVSGRIGWEPVERMFAEAGFDARVVHGTVVPQCPRTSTEFFVQLEQSLTFPARPAIGFTGCSFFEDPDAARAIDAAQAKRRLQGSDRKPCFHRLWVIEGRPRAEASIS